MVARRREAYRGLERKQGEGSTPIGALSRGESGPQEAEVGFEVWQQAGAWGGN